MNIFKKISKNNNQISNADTEHDFKVAQLTDTDEQANNEDTVTTSTLSDKQEQLIKESKATDADIDEMPSANIKGRDGGNKKKLQQVIIAVIGFVIVLVGLGTAMARWQESKELKRIEESEKAAQEQKQMATGRVDIADEQARIANESFKDLPPPAGVELENDADDLFAEDQSIAATSSSQDYQTPTYIEPVNPTSRYANEAPSTEYVSPPPVQSESTNPVNNGGLFASAYSNTDDSPTQESIPSIKGANSDVLVDVNAVKVAEVSPSKSENKNSQVGGNLTPTVLSSSSASRRNSKSLMILRGTTIPCVLKTKIDSTYQGFTVCQISRDVYSADGKTLLLERGSQVFGEQNVELNQGQARVAVLWTRVETPEGVSVNLESPATGQLGEMGVGAKVNNHFWKRFGGSIMLSIIQDAISVASSRMEDRQDGNNNTTIQNTESTTSSMAEEALKNTINIPPTATVNAGTVINIMVVRDVDFSAVYKLQRR